jgi:hypothetical protein
MESLIKRVIPTSLGGTLDESTLSPEQKSMLEAQKKAKGGMIKSSASKRADGCAIRGKTKA